MRRLTVLLCLAGLAGCGEKEEPAGPGAARPDELRLVLDYFPNADHAGIYAAQPFFEQAGLDVEIVTPPDPSAPLKLLQAGRADVAISYEPEVLLARDKGADLLSIAAVVQKPLTSLMSLESDFTVADLDGAKVGTAGIPYQSAYLKSIVAKAGLDPGAVEEINVGFELSRAMISGRVDATLGAFWNYEGTELRRRKREPVILRMEDVGVPVYNELVLVARREDLDREGAARLRRFLLAVSRGHEALREDVSAGLDPLLEAEPGLDEGLQRAVVEATMPVFFPEDTGRPWGFQDPSEWQAYGEWMLANELIKRAPGRAMTNELLPGEGLGEGTAGLE